MPAGNKPSSLQSQRAHRGSEQRLLSRPMYHVTWGDSSKRAPSSTWNSDKSILGSSYWWKQDHGLHLSRPPALHPELLQNLFSFAMSCSLQGISRMRNCPPTFYPWASKLLTRTALLQSPRQGPRRGGDWGQWARGIVGEGLGNRFPSIGYPCMDDIPTWSQVVVRPCHT